jgi:LacI family transcriptional regulator
MVCFGMKVSSLDVAREAGVSPATVSLVLNGRTSVSLADATRKRVQEAADRLGYRPNQIARNLLRGRTGTIGLVLPSLASSFVAQIAEGVQEGAAEAESNVLLAHTRNDPAFEAAQVEMLLRHRVDGVVVVAGEKTLPLLGDRLSVLERCRVPCVVVDDRTHVGRVDCVVSDDRQGAEAAVRHLIGGGHRRIAHLSAGDLTSSARDRLEGFLGALRQAGLQCSPEWVAGSSYMGVGNREAFARLLASPLRPTAIFAANDRHLADGLPTLARLGLNVPSDLALVGYANYDFAAYLGLTSVDQNPSEMGRVALRRLLDRMECNTTKPTLIQTPVKLVVRRSCGVSCAVHPLTA